MTTEQRAVLEVVLLHVGLPEIAAMCATERVGLIEARVTEVLNRTDVRDDVQQWRRIWGAKHTARRIRKPINELDDYLADAEWTLRQ